jgi:parallel beta helix pectate lyase-like protein
MTKSLVRSRKTLLAGLVLVAFAFPASAFAQATRTWVSGVGDDVNPCSRTAPCKTFAGAISKTAAGGEIDVLDPGGFGGVTITKSITIDGLGFHAGLVVQGTNAIIINAGAADKVTLRGLDINGLNGTASPALNGVRILSARSVTIQNSDIYGFGQNGVDMEDSVSNAKLTVLNSRIINNTGNGVVVAAAAGVISTATVRNSQISGNGCGLVASGHTLSGVFTVDCDTSATATTGSARINAFDNIINDNDLTAGASGSSGVFANGQSSVVRISSNLITGNTFGLRALDFAAGGTTGIVSFQNNLVIGNLTNGSPQGTATPT